MRVQVREGEMTKTIYSHIMEQKYDKAQAWLEYARVHIVTIVDQEISRAFKSAFLLCL